MLKMHLQNPISLNLLVTRQNKNRFTPGRCETVLNIDLAADCHGLQLFLGSEQISIHTASGTGVPSAFKQGAGMKPESPGRSPPPSPVNSGGGPNPMSPAFSTKYACEHCNCPLPYVTVTTDGSSALS